MDGITGERSSYGPLANLLNAVGATLKPKVFCVGELADQGAGHPDFGLYTAKQVQRGRPREGQAPERGVVEVKSPHEDLRARAVREQVTRQGGCTMGKTFVYTPDPDNPVPPSETDCTLLNGLSDEALERRGSGGPRQPSRDPNHGNARPDRPCGASGAGGNRTFAIQVRRTLRLLRRRGA